MVDGWVEVHEVLQSYWGWLLIHIQTRELSHHSFHELAIQLKLLYHPGQEFGRWWIVGTTAMTSGSNHPANM